MEIVAGLIVIALGGALLSYLVRRFNLLDKVEEKGEDFKEE